jgi:fatty-acyl-CoA synthase
VTAGAALGLHGDQLLEMTPCQVLETHARRHPDLEYLTVDGKSYTYGDVWALSGSVATALARRGVRRGDRVATWLPNGTAWIVSAFALARLGAANVLVNARFRPREVAALVTRSGSRGLITDRAPGPEFAAEVAVGALQWTVTVDEAAGSDLTDWAELTSTPTDDTEVRDAASGLSPLDTLYVIYTSGTTGLPKGSMTRHGAALKNAFSSGKRIGFCDDDRLLCFLPLSHTFGAVNAFLNTLTHGVHLDLQREFEPDAVLDAVARRGVTAMFGVPTHYTMLVSAHRSGGRARDLHTLTKGCVGGGTVSAELADAIENELGITGLTRAYGMTESTALISQSSWDAPRDIRLGTDGPAMPDVAVRLVHAETGADVAVGEPGNICIAGFGVHAGYLGMEHDASLGDDGWWETGDIGSLDAQGNLTVVGRSKDMYKTSGFNVYPAEVEAYLCGHPAIAECAVVGIPDERKQETGVAFLIPVAGATIDPDEVREFARTGIAGYKVPEHIIVVDDFPRSAATRKIQKHELRARAEQLLTTAAEPR